MIYFTDSPIYIYTHIVFHIMISYPYPFDPYPFDQAVDPFPPTSRPCPLPLSESSANLWFQRKVPETTTMIWGPSVNDIWHMCRCGGEGKEAAHLIGWPLVEALLPVPKLNDLLSFSCRILSIKSFYRISKTNCEFHALSTSTSHHGIHFIHDPSHTYSAICWTSRDTWQKSCLFILSMAQNHWSHNMDDD